MINSEKVGEIITGRDWFNTKSEKVILAVGRSFYLAQYMFGAVGRPGQNQPLRWEDRDQVS